MRRLLKQLLWVPVALLVVALLVWAFIPPPVAVDAVEVLRGPMRVTIDEEGRTRVRERYVVSAPLAGTLRRIPHKAGDAVEVGATVLATIVQPPATLLDPRAQREAEARVGAAEAAFRQADSVILRTEQELKQAEVEHLRLQRLAERQAATEIELEQAALAVAIRQAQLEVARQAREIAQFELAQARAALLPQPQTPQQQPDVELLSPVSGQVLRVIQESETAVTAGQSLIEVGDARDIEVVVDLLSRDAVQVQPGTEALLERWGGGEILRGSVRRVEPSGFTKISALGVEEQRVNVIIDFVEPPERGIPLGDGYRVEARIVVWERPDVLKVPTGALLRDAEHWAVFAIEDDRAVLRRLRIGRMSAREAEVLDGLAEGEMVIIHPSDAIRPGASVTLR